MQQSYQHLETPIGNVLARLDNPRRTGKEWAARCPSHEDRSPSLSLTEAHDGRVLVTCFAGCSADEIVRALGMELRDLFPPSPMPFVRPSPRHGEPVPLPRKAIGALVRSHTFAFTWEAAKALAGLDSDQQRADVVVNWDYLTSRGSVPLMLELACVIRGAAIFRFCTSKSIERPGAIRTAVKRLLDDISTQEEAA